VCVRALLMILIPKHRKAAMKGSGRTGKGVSTQQRRVKRETSPDARLITKNNASPVLLKRNGSCQSVASTVSTESAPSSLPDSIAEQDCPPVSKHVKTFVLN